MIWKPIATAPKKHQKPILLGFPGSVHVGIWYEGKRKQGWLVIDEPKCGIGASPTHWMPLPEPPTQ
ncbi:DUF551 domain-containing protein [Mesoterricola silvestris]|uniref:DUF551 domain-containing protein n=1 Tax=Mesoterricola silvestris TaxID=2927979 RepID=A0AA48H5N6_9BACT|nr:hypothetical protein METEAL_14920 [Mesoterricola silvestris]